jgi:hypothetical protein
MSKQEQVGDLWTQGYACAVATLQRMDGSRHLTTEVKELMQAAGLTSKAQCEKYEIDPYDLAALFPEGT